MENSYITELGKRFEAVLIKFSETAQEYANAQVAYSKASEAFALEDAYVDIMITEAVGEKALGSNVGARAQALLVIKGQKMVLPGLDEKARDVMLTQYLQTKAALADADLRQKLARVSLDIVTESMKLTRATLYSMRNMEELSE